MPPRDNSLGPPRKLPQVRDLATASSFGMGVGTVAQWCAAVAGCAVLASAAADSPPGKLAGFIAPLRGPQPALGARVGVCSARSLHLREKRTGAMQLSALESTGKSGYAVSNLPVQMNPNVAPGSFSFRPRPRLAGAQAATLRRARKAIDGTRRPQVLKDVIRNVPSSWAASSVELFKAADLDESGEIDREELAAMFKRAGTTVTDAQISEIMRVISSDRKGTVITWPDFASAVELVECDAPPSCTSPQRRAPGRARSPRPGGAGCSCNRSWRATMS